MKKNKNKEERNDNKLIHDSVLRSGAITNFVTGRKKRRTATAMIYEKVGSSEIFEGAYPLLKGTIKELGKYCVIYYKGKHIFIDIPDPSDYIISSDKKIGKIVEYVKYAEDDFRIRTRIKGTWYKREVKPVMEEIEIEDEENAGQTKTISVQKKDPKTNEYLYTEKETKYKEPLGVTQEGRDAIRTGNEYEQKMQAFRKRNGGFLEKYGTVVVPIVGFVVVAMIFMFAMKFSADMVSEVGSEVKLLREQNVPWYADDDKIKNLANEISKADNEKNSPPVK